jgi:nucleoid-associated protein YgaU
MPPQTILIWAGGAAAAAIVAAGAGFYWAHPGFMWAGHAAPIAAAPSPEPAQANLPPPATVVQAPAPVSTPAPAPSAQPAGQTAVASLEAPLKPAFDVVSVEPTGEAVIAGRAAPNAKVELKDADKTVAVATADASGQFVIIPPTFAPGDHSLSLAAEGDKTQLQTSKTVAVSVPQREAAAQVVAKTTATEPRPVPAIPTLAASPPVEGARIAIRSVEAAGAGGLITTGTADPNALVRLYLNGADLADARTQADGRWSLTIKSGLTHGAYLVRADEINAADAKVVASAETQFTYPGSAAPAVAAAPSSASPADVVIGSIQTALVAPGHTLWALSQNYYGDPTRYPVIYEANKPQIHNPNLIFPGQVFVVPKSDAKP